MFRFTITEMKASVGLDWLPKRIYRDPSNINDSLKHVIVIHSPLTNSQQHAIKNEQDTNDTLLDNSVEGVDKWLQGSCPRKTTDPEFLYGMQRYTRESVDDNTDIKVSTIACLTFGTKLICL